MSDRCHESEADCDTSAIDCLQDGNEGILVPEALPMRSDGRSGGPFARRLGSSAGVSRVASPTQEMDACQVEGAPRLSLSFERDAFPDQHAASRKSSVTGNDRPRTSGQLSHAEASPLRMTEAGDDDGGVYYPAPIPTAMRTPPSLIGTMVQLHSMSLATQILPLADVHLRTRLDQQEGDDSGIAHSEDDVATRADDSGIAETVESDSDDEEPIEETQGKNVYTPATVLLEHFLQTTLQEPVPTEEEIHRDAVARGALLDIVKVQHERQKERTLPGYARDMRAAQLSSASLPLDRSVGRETAALRQSVGPRPTLLAIDQAMRQQQKMKHAAELQQARRPGRPQVGASGPSAAHEPALSQSPVKEYSAEVQAIREAMRHSLQSDQAIEEEDVDEDVPLDELWAKKQQERAQNKKQQDEAAAAEGSVECLAIGKLASPFKHEPKQQSLAERMKEMQRKREQIVHVGSRDREVQKETQTMSLAQRRTQLMAKQRQKQ